MNFTTKNWAFFREFSWFFQIFLTFLSKIVKNRQKFVCVNFFEKIVDFYENDLSKNEKSEKLKKNSENSEKISEKIGGKPSKSNMIIKNEHIFTHIFPEKK